MAEDFYDELAPFYHLIFDDCENRTASDFYQPVLTGMKPMV